MNPNKDSNFYPSSSTMNPPNPSLSYSSSSSHGGGGGGRIVSQNYRAPAFSHADQAQMSVPSSSSSSSTQRKGTSLGEKHEGRPPSVHHLPQQDEALRRNGGGSISSSVYGRAPHETSSQSYYSTTPGDSYGGRAGPGAVPAGQYPPRETEGDREREAAGSQRVIQKEDHTTSSGLYPPLPPQNASRPPLPSHYYPQRGIGNPMMSSYSSATTSSYTDRRLPSSDAVHQATRGGAEVTGRVPGGHEGARSVKEHQEYLLKQAAGEQGGGGGAPGGPEANGMISRVNEGRGIGMHKRQEGMDGHQESLNFYRQVHPSHPTTATSLHYAKAYPPPSTQGASYPSSSSSSLPPSSSHSYQHPHQPPSMMHAGASQHHPPSSHHLPGGHSASVGGHLSSSSSCSPPLPPVSYPSTAPPTSAPFASYPPPNFIGGPAVQHQSRFIPSGNMTLSGSLDDPRRGASSSFGDDAAGSGGGKGFFSRLFKLGSLLSSSSGKEGYDKTSSHAPGMIGMTGSQSYSDGRGVDGGVKDDEDDDLKDEPPLLEELGIRPDEIWQRVKSVVFFYKVDHDLLVHSDMSGPLAIAISLAFLLLMSGKASFGHIYGLSIIGSVCTYILLNLMSPVEEGIDLYSTISILGYGLLPVVFIALFSLFVNLKTSFIGLAVSILAILWCTATASRFFESALRMHDQWLLVAYPVSLFYASFMVIAVL